MHDAWCAAPVRLWVSGSLFHVGSGLEEIEIVRCGHERSGSGPIITRLVRLLEKTTGQGPKGLAAQAELSPGPKGPAEGEAHIMEVGVELGDHDRVVGISRRPGGIEAVGPVGNE